MKLYYSPGACSLAARIALHEHQIPAEFEKVDLKTKQTETGKDFLQINPKGAVPTLQLDNGEILTENSIIQQYIADYAKTLPPVGDLKRYRALEWLNFVSTELHKGFGPFFNPKITPEFRDEVFIPILQKKFAILEKHLEKNKFIMGDQFSLADGYLFTVLRWAHHFKMDTNWVNLKRYFEDVKKRKSVELALQEEGLKN